MISIRRDHRNSDIKRKLHDYLLEYRGRCRAVPAQSEVEKEEAARGQSCKLQAASFKHPGNANWNIFDQL
tara:strand:+ start:210 stop:419 length:210 start_codon:yes stop_codon:yes gene_type:complete